MLSSDKATRDYVASKKIWMLILQMKERMMDHI
jgi:hypothetical protein